MLVHTLTSLSEILSIFKTRIHYFNIRGISENRWVTFKHVTLTISKFVHAHWSWDVILFGPKWLKFIFSLVVITVSATIMPSHCSVLQVKILLTLTEFSVKKIWCKSWKSYDVTSCKESINFKQCIIALLLVALSGLMLRLPNVIFIVLHLRSISVLFFLLSLRCVAYSIQKCQKLHTNRCRCHVVGPISNLYFDVTSLLGCLQSVKTN